MIRSLASVAFLLLGIVLIAVGLFDPSENALLSIPGGVSLFLGAVLLPRSRS